MSELVEFLLWTTCTAGKNSATITPRFNTLIEEETNHNKKHKIKKHAALTVIQSHGNRIRGMLRKHGIGQYNRISKAWKMINDSSIDGQKIASEKFLKYAPRDHFTQIPGIGMKTASFFVLSNREWEEAAALDVHILKFLSKTFPAFNIPNVTPTNRSLYKQIEKLFVGHAAVNNLKCADLDLQIWTEFSNN